MSAPKLTAAGRDLYYRNLAGTASLHFTTVQIGAGRPAGSAETMTALAAPKMTVDAAMLKKQDFVEITCRIDNTALTEGFDWTETGVFAQNPDDPDNRLSDILYCYHDISDSPTPMKPAAEETFTRYHTIPVIVGNMESVTATLNDAAAVTKLDMDAHNTSETAHENRFSEYVKKSEKAAPSGVATLNEEGKIPEEQLPAAAKAVIEKATLAEFPETGAAETVYIDKAQNKTYRWDAENKVYVPIGSSLELGETGTTAGRGDRTKTAYEHSQTMGNPHQTKISDIADYAVYSAAATAPANTKLLWIDTGNGGILKYHNGTAWTPVASVWG